MATTLLALARLIAKEFGYMSGTCSAAGTTTTIVDTSTDSPFDLDDDDTLPASAWAKIESDTATPALNVGEVRRIKGGSGGYTPASRMVTTNAAFSNATTATQSYGIYFKMPPTRVGQAKGIDEYVNDFLRTHRYRHHQLLTMVTDGDMESISTWTGTNATLAQVTTGATVTAGKKAMSVTTTAANGYGQSAAIAVPPYAQIMHVVADVKANTGTAKLQLWDATNSAEIASVSTTSRFPTTIWLTSANIPSTCHSVRVRLIGVGSGDVADWDNVSVRPAREMTLALPSWVTHRGQIERVKYTVDAGASLDTGVLGRDSRALEDVYDFDLIEDYGAANQFQIRVPQGRTGSHLYAVGLRYFPELSADTDTTDCDQDWLKASVLAAIYEDLGKGSEVKRWLEEATKLGREPHWAGRAWKPVRGL